MILLSLIVCALIATFYFLFYEPKQRIKRFTATATKLGYKVLQLPYKFMGLAFLELVERDNRSLKVFKEEIAQYDLVVGNTFTSLQIIPVHPNLIKDFMIDSIKLQKHPLFAEIFQLFNDGGIAFTQGEDWKRKRRIISSVFHYDFINQLVPAIQSQIEAQFQIIDQKIKNNQSIQLFPVVSKILSSVVAKCFFGSEVKQYQIDGKPYCQYYIDLLNEIVSFGESLEHIIFRMTTFKFGLTSRTRKIKQKLDLLKKVAREITVKELEKVKNHKETEKNIITALYENNMLQSSEEDTDPSKYTIDELIGEFFAFFAAGTDTTSNLINLIFHYLSQNAVYLQRIEEEYKQVKRQNYTRFEELKQMKWVDSVYKQALRINGPAFQLIFRVASQEMNAGGLGIAKGTTVNIVPIVMGYRSKVFDKPFEFRPERWMENNALPPYSYIPFSAGERGCIGQYLAKIETRIVMERIIKKYKFKARNPIRMKFHWIYETMHSDFDMAIKSESSQ